MKRKYMKSVLILIFTATGLFAQTNIKWQQTFDDTVIPGGWQVIDADGSASGLELVQTDSTFEAIELNAHAGQAFWSSNAQNSNRAGVIDEWLISPRISVIYDGDSLYFWAGANDQGFDDSIRVKISTTGNHIKDFSHQLANFKVDGPAGSWHRYGFDLSAFDSSDIYFAINYYIKDGGPGGLNSDFIWIDHPLISGDVVASLEDNININPDQLVLHQNYPNPFNPSTTIGFELVQAEFVQLTIFDITGRRINQLVNQQLESGYHKVVWDGQDNNGQKVSSGVYICQIQSQNFRQSKKMIYLQ